MGKDYIQKNVSHHVLDWIDVVTRFFFNLFFFFYIQKVYFITIIIIFYRWENLKLWKDIFRWFRWVVETEQAPIKHKKCALYSMKKKRVQPFIQIMCSYITLTSKQVQGNCDDNCLPHFSCPFNRFIPPTYLAILLTSEQ